MAGQLVQVDSWEYSTDVNSVTLTGIDSDDVYMLVTSCLLSDATSAVATAMRFTESGTPNSTANYDEAFVDLKVNTTFQDIGHTNYSEFRFGAVVNGNNRDSGIHYIYNANNSSEYTFMTCEGVRYGGSTSLFGRQGGGVFTSASAVDGIQVGILTDGTKNLTAGKMALYKVV